MNICRLCLVDSEELISLFQDSRILYDVPICDLISELIPIVIDESEQNLPQSICLNCLEIINTFLNLRSVAIENDLTLRKRLEYEDLEQVQEEEVTEFLVETLEDEIVEAESCQQESQECEINEEIEGIKAEPYIEILPNGSESKTHAAYCEICKEHFATKSSLKRHQQRRHSNIQFRCDSCVATFKTKHDIDRHIQVKHTKKTSSNSLKTLQEIPSNLDKMFEELEQPLGLLCVWCPFTEHDEETLNLHMRAEHQDMVSSGKMFCSICPFHITSMDSMIEHARSHNEKVRTHRCLVCNKNFPFDEKFIVHLQRHRKNADKSCCCPECGKRFTKVSLMKDHIRFIHEKVVKFSCPKCGQGFGSKSALNGHVRRHNEANKYQCMFCPKTFSSHNLLNSHKMIHLENRPLECKLCHKRFKHQKVLSDHMKIHKGDRPCYICSICDKYLQTSYALTRHMLTHSGVKAFKCEYCDKAYAQKNDLNKHLRIHVGENTYRCNYEDCNESFRIIAELRIHEKVHYFRADDSIVEES